MVDRQTVLLIGNGPTALSALRSLSASFCVAAVLRDTPVASTRDPVQELAAAFGIPVHPVGGVGKIAALASKIRPEAVVISSYDRLLGPEVLSLSRFVNVHYSPLPRYRGRANVNWAIINGDKEAAITIHSMAPGLDNGNILYQEGTAIGPRDTAGSLYDRLNAIQERELGRIVVRVLSGYEGQIQDESGSTYGCTRIPSDGEIDWTAETVVIDRLIRALSPPFPGAFTYFEGRRLIISRAAVPPDAPVYEGRIAGRVIASSPHKGWVDVLTGDGVLRLVEVEPEPGHPCPPSSLIKSTRATLGLSKQHLLHRIMALEERLGSLLR
jgi:methionyl-tRNA formyltransferase